MLVQIDNFPVEFHVFHAQLSQYPKPKNSKNYEDAAKKPEWVQAMNKEIEALCNSNTWDLVDLPVGKKAICGKWVYKSS